MSSNYYNTIACRFLRTVDRLYFKNFDTGTQVESPEDLIGILQAVQAEVTEHSEYIGKNVEALFHIYKSEDGSFTAGLSSVLKISVYRP